MTDSSKNKTILHLFEKQVNENPYRIAVASGDEQLTYQVLNEKSNQLARLIRHRFNDALPKDTLIALFLERSIDIIIAILGTLKAGAAYVPISPKSPKERIQIILEEAKAELILTQSSFSALFDNNILIFLDKKSYNEEPTHDLLPYATGQDLMYVIYTSGTTGKPKGVAIEHASFYAFIKSISDLDAFRSMIKTHFAILSLTEYTFDMFGFEHGFPLACGGTILLSDLAHLEKNLSNYPIHIIQQTPSVWQQLIHLIPPDILKKVVCLIGGEAISSAILSQLLKKCSTVISAYGPTETTVWSSYYECHHASEASLLGNTFSNEFFYVLDDNYQPVPTGSIGHLYIGGVGLARGYFNQEDLTNEKFITNPFATSEEKALGFTRLYKTGDRVKKTEKGNLEYRGRSDLQIKIRGLRIEPEEIEKTLTEIKGIKQSCIVVKEHENSQYLVAYYVWDNRLSLNKITSEQIQTLLSQKLPEYMLPNQLIELKEMPLNTNGKIDRRILSTLKWKNEDNYAPPSTELETRMCLIWKDILQVKLVGILDDFFNLGGNSIHSIILSTRLHKEGITCSAHDIQSYRTIKELASHLETTGTANETKKQPLALSDLPKEYKISRILSDKLNALYDIEACYPVFNLQPFFLQYVISQKTDQGHFVIYYALDYYHEVNVLLYKQAWELMVKKFPSLRVCFNWDELPLQIVCKTGCLDFILHDISKEKSGKDQKHAERKIINQIYQGTFNLSTLPLFSIHLIKYSQDHFTLFFKTHHIITDGWSIKNLVDTLHDFYHCLLNNKNYSPQEDFLYFQVQNYILQNQDSANKYMYESIKDIPENYSINPVLSHPTRKKINSNYKCNTIRELNLFIDGDKYLKLQEIGKKEGLTLNTFTQFAWHRLLHNYIPGDYTVIGMTMSGRSAPIPGMERSLGFHINSLPLVMHWNIDQSLREQLNQLQQKIILLEKYDYANYDLFRKYIQVEILFQNYPHFIENFEEGTIAERSCKSSPIMEREILNIACTPSKQSLQISLAFDLAYLTVQKGKKLLTQLDDIFQNIINELC